ncbi:hypothetical protein GCM10027569_88670 [Flindersiella endophytica]
MPAAAGVADNDEILLCVQDFPKTVPDQHVTVHDHDANRIGMAPLRGVHVPKATKLSFGRLRFDLDLREFPYVFRSGLRRTAYTMASADRNPCVHAESTAGQRPGLQ